MKSRAGKRQREEEDLKSDRSAIFPPGLSHTCGSHSIVTSVGMLIRTDTAHADMEASCHTQTSHPALTVAALSFCHRLYKHVSHPPQVTNLTVFSVLLVDLLITYLSLHLHLWCTFLIHSVISTHGPSQVVVSEVAISHALIATCQARSPQSLQ